MMKEAPLASPRDNFMAHNYLAHRNLDFRVGSWGWWGKMMRRDGEAEWWVGRVAMREGWWGWSTAMEAVRWGGRTAT